jgi:hypothetical protein
MQLVQRPRHSGCSKFGAHMIHENLNYEQNKKVKLYYINESHFMMIKKGTVQQQQKRNESGLPSIKPSDVAPTDFL